MKPWTLSTSFGRALILFVCVALATGCGFKKAKEDAGFALKRHYEAIASHSEEAVLAGYGEKFFSVVPRDQWAKRLAIIENKLGEYQSFDIVNWNVNSKMGTNGGTYVALTCKVSYSKHPAEERLTLFRKSDDDDFLIVQHGISSDAFLSE